MVSYACSSKLSSGLTTPAAPPSAETVWLRMGYTLDRTAMLSLGLTSAAAIAARRPAAPPPTSSMSWVETSMATPLAARSAAPNQGPNPAHSPPNWLRRQMDSEVWISRSVRAAVLDSHRKRRAPELGSGGECFILYRTGVYSGQTKGKDIKETTSSARHGTVSAREGRQS